MATKKRAAEINALVADVEAVAKRIRANIRKQTKALPKDLKLLAGRLRKRAAQAAGQVEKYMHELRLELEGAVKPKRVVRRPARARARR